MTESGLERSGKRLRVALHSTKWIVEGGAGGRTGPRVEMRAGASSDDGKRLGACGKRLRVALHSTKWILEGGAGGRTGPRANRGLAPHRMTESGLERSGEHAESCTPFLAKRLPRSEATRELGSKKEGGGRFLCCGSSAVHVFQKHIVFARGFPRPPRGSFLFSQVEKRTVLENGALGSLKIAKNGHQDRFFGCFFRGSILDRFFTRF